MHVHCSCLPFESENFSVQRYRLSELVLSLHLHCQENSHPFTIQNSTSVTDCVTLPDSLQHAVDTSVRIWDITHHPYELCRKPAVGAVYLSTLFLLETRREPLLCGLTVLNLERLSETQPICWFPPDISPRYLSVHPAGSLAVVESEDGQLLFLDISKSPFCDYIFIGSFRLLYHYMHVTSVKNPLEYGKTVFN